MLYLCWVFFFQTAIHSPVKSHQLARALVPVSSPAFFLLSCLVSHQYKFQHPCDCLTTFLQNKAQKLAIIVITGRRSGGKQAGTPRSSCPEPCPDGFWVTPRMETPNLSGQLVPVLGHPHSEEVCPDVQKEPLIFESLEPGPLVLALDTTEKSLALSSLHSPFRYLYTLMNSHPLGPLHSSQLSQPFLIAQMLQSLHHPCGPFLDSLQYVHVSFILGGPYLDPALQMWHYQCWVDSKDYLPWSAGFTESCQQDNLFQLSSSSK